MTALMPPEKTLIRFFIKVQDDLVHYVACDPEKMIACSIASDLNSKKITAKFSNNNFNEIPMNHTIFCLTLESLKES